MPWREQCKPPRNLETSLAGHRLEGRGKVVLTNRRLLVGCRRSLKLPVRACPTIHSTYACRLRIGWAILQREHHRQIISSASVCSSEMRVKPSTHGVRFPGTRSECARPRRNFTPTRTDFAGTWITFPRTRTNLAGT